MNMLVLHKKFVRTNEMIYTFALAFIFIS